MFVNGIHGILAKKERYLVFIYYLEIIWIPWITLLSFNKNKKRKGFTHNRFFCSIFSYLETCRELEDMV